MDDLHQEAYIAFIALVQEWRHDRSFYPYFLKIFPRRLRRTVWQLSRGWRKVKVTYVDHHELIEMLDALPSGEEEGGDLEVDELLEVLPEGPRALMRRHLVDGVPLSAAAREMRINRKTAVAWASRAIFTLRSLAERETA